tara:strand:- start:1082 stop:1561 length:480 start_codon:yes stop_codon:yes gene_type:complete
MSESDFFEKQYLGLNKVSLGSRLALATFCFLVYYWRENINKEGELFFFTGIAIILFSVLLFFVLHFQTQVLNGSIILDGLWTSRKIKIDTSSIVSAEKVNYSKYIINFPVYNLYYKGTIRFYTRSKDAVKLIDKDGLIYMIGSQRAEELCQVVNKKLRK